MSAATYRYAARTAAGERVRGSMRAPSAEAVAAALHARALFVTAVTPDRALLRPLALSLRPGGARRRALLAFFRSFATLVRAGVPIGRALEVTRERAGDPGLRESIAAILADVEHGASLGEAMSRRPHAIPPLAVAMIGAGERGGILDDVLERVASLLERDAALRRQVRSALAYPSLVLAAAVVLVVFLIARIVPMFATLFASFSVDLPAPTRVLLAAGDVLSRPLPWLVALALCLSLLGAGLAARRSRRGALVLDALRLRVPVVGPLLRGAVAARVVRTLAALVRAGVELVTALETAAPVARSRVFEDALHRVASGLRAGESLTAPLEATRAFDPLVAALVRVGDEAGRLDAMLETAADYLDADVEASIATLAAVIEPLLIGGLGLVVGAIVFSIFIPLYSLIGSVAR